MKNKINVLHIIDKYSYGGVETIVYSLIENFKDSKINCYYYFLRDLKSKPHIKKNNVFIRNFPKSSSLPLFELIKLIKNKNINIVHTHHRKGFYLAFILSYLFPKVKFIHHEHGDILVRNRVYGKIMRLYKNRIHKIITVSNVVKQKLIEKVNFDPKKIAVLYNFVDTKKFNRKSIKINIKKEKEKLGIKKDEFVIGFVGRLAKVKGCKYLIKALPYLAFPYKVLIAGDGPERKRLEKLAKILKVENKVIFLGYVDKPENVYVLLDVLVMPSLSEASPLTFFEAKSFRFPIICSNILSLKEFVKDNRDGVFFKSKNEKDLSTKICLINKDINLRRKLSSSYNNISEFSLSKYLRRLKGIYKNVE